MSPWKPARTLVECNDILSAPGQIFEMENQIIDGRVLRVYKNIWPSLRACFLHSVSQHSSKEFIIFENERFTFQQCLDQSLKVAGLLRDKYGVTKGDRVAIVSRNYPEYISAFWGIQLLGGIGVMVNAWLPDVPLHHSVSHANSKVVFADAERALIFDVERLRREVGTKGFIVFRPHEGKSRPGSDWVDCASVIDAYKGNPKDILDNEPSLLPEDNATIFFTSGTTGLPKGVLSTQRSFLSNIPNTMVGRLRSYLRRGEPIPEPQPGDPQKGTLISVPLFHVTGFTALTMIALTLGQKLVLMRRWVPEEGARLIKQENISAAGGVPSMVTDILESSAVGAPSIETFLFGGAPAHAGLALQASEAFPTATLSQAYGMTETNSVAISHAGEDYIQRPQSTGLPCPINDIIIVKDNQVAKPEEVGEIWLKGSNVMRGYWNDPEATRKVLTPDGWYKSGDIGYLDAEGFLYVKDRIKDIIIRGGENIDSVSVENAFFADNRVLEAAAVGVPDKRLGELPVAIVTLKKGYEGTVQEQELLKAAEARLPKFAVPVMVIIQKELLERNPAGKIVKQGLRKLAAKEWAERAPAVKAKL